MAKTSFLFLVGLFVLVALADASYAEPTLRWPQDGSWLSSGQIEVVFEVSESYETCTLIFDGAELISLSNFSIGPDNISENAENSSANVSMPENESTTENVSGTDLPRNMTLPINVSEGNHNLSVRCSLDSTVSESEAHSFFVDLTAPSAEILFPEEGAYLSTRQIGISADINDSLDPEAGCAIWLGNSTGQTWNLTEGIVLNLTLNYSAHTINGACTDKAGNTLALARSFTIIPVNSSFEFSTDKNVYFTGEQINIISQSPINTTLQISILKDLSLTPIDVFSTVIGNTKTIFFRTFTEPGFYSVIASFDYYGYRQTISRNFTVRNNDVSLTASANATNVKKNELIKFEANIEKNISGVEFKWDMNNDGTYETSGKQVIYSFDSLGDKTIRLQADDSYNLLNASLVIHVKDVGKLSFIVLDNTTGLPLKNATVELDELEQQTNETGGVMFQVLQGVYSARASKQGYFARYIEVVFTDDSLITFRLVDRNKDTAPPRIYLISPEDGVQVTSTKVKATFMVTDASNFNCTVYYSEYSNWYQAIEVKQQISNNTNTTVEIVGKPGDNYWKVECVDALGNLGVSLKNRFVVSTDSSSSAAGGSTSGSGSGSGSETDDYDIPSTDSLGNYLNSIMKELDGAISDFKSVPYEEEMASDALLVKAGLDQAKNDVQKLRRDLSNLQYVESSSEDLASREDIRTKANNIRDETISGITVTKKLEFTQYPNDQAVGGVIERANAESGQELTSRQKDEIIRQNTALQNKFIANTAVWNLELDYLSGRSELITLVVKQMGYSGSWDDIIILEDIPKTIAQSADEVEFLTPYSVIERDPLFKVQIDSQNRTIYYIRKELSPDLIKETNTIIMLTKIQEKAENSITGFATIIDGEGGYSIWILIILILAILIFVYNSRLMDATRSTIHRKLDGVLPSRGLSGARELISLTSQRIDEGNLKDARKMYAELSLVYSHLPVEKKREIYPEITCLRDDFDIWVVSGLLKEGRNYLISRDFELASRTYEQINKAYSRLTPEKKQEIYPDINEFVSLMRSMRGK